jgi:hypothetical protein
LQRLDERVGQEVCVTIDADRHAPAFGATRSDRPLDTAGPR